VLLCEQAGLQKQYPILEWLGLPFIVLSLLAFLWLFVYLPTLFGGPTISGSGLEPVKKSRKRRTRARKAVWQGAREGASPQRAVTERATRPDGLSCSRPQGCVSFWLHPRCSGGTRPLRVLPPPSRLGQVKNPAAMRHFVIFSQILSSVKSGGLRFGY
jgi:hypothetical protein